MMFPTIKYHKKIKFYIEFVLTKNNLIFKELIETNLYHMKMRGKNKENRV